MLWQWMYVALVSISMYPRLSVNVCVCAGLWLAEPDTQWVMVRQTRASENWMVAIDKDSQIEGRMSLDEVLVGYLLQPF